MTDNDSGYPPTDPANIPAWLWRTFFIYVLDPHHSGPITAIATVVSAITAIALLATTLAYTVYSSRQWQATKQAADAAKLSTDNVIAVQRPWVRLTLHLSHLNPIPNGYDLTMIPTIRNVGVGVASDVNERIEYRVPYSNPLQDQQRHKNVFDVADDARDWCQHLAPNQRGLQTYFPGDNEQQPQWTLNVLDSDMGKSGFSVEGEPHFLVIVYACVQYRFRPFPEWHHTSMVYELSANQNGIPFMLKANKRYAPEQLIFQPFPFAPEWGD